MSTLNTRTIVALLTVGLLVLGAAFTGVLWVLVRNADSRDPEITAYAHGTTVTVPPFMYCTVRMEDCRYGETVSLDVPAGYPLQLSLPTQISGAPWLIQQVYELPSGEEVAEMSGHAEFDGARAITIDSQPEPDLRLVGVEIQLPILARDETGREFYVPHAVWSIKTA
ncbi:DUF2771 domain-containing protein [Nocardia donostiensis]|uniref:DUF2771 domain-containing protein n=1 Tax=Nocardia donostiensis TaxID=1538463 RepID=A0A1W0B6P5_9NOCA|nr:DUF2771 domain-containing protein [Nocardia donostiensis]ONM50391.1 hypothetical protein B0T46_00160 [Nocardia donostiensis]OQS17375.1 hypothetical protein B0T36_02000 [Nocardia donostiensis]OQS18076.1 hypothetical protein B0T44_21400 [Nocardia donostiensis]